MGHPSTGAMKQRLTQDDSTFLHFDRHVKAWQSLLKNEIKPAETILRALFSLTKTEWNNINICS